jgi:hypothetical protein
MRRCVPALLLLLAAAGISAAPRERLRVLPLDTTVVVLDTGISTLALIPENDDLSSDAEPVSHAVLISKEFHPRFAMAVARAARRVDVVVFAHAAGDTSSRYELRLDSLGFSQRTRAVGRRFVPPSQPEFDPATGEMTPGERRGHAEGPGRVTTLAATAKWVLWNRAGDSALTTGISTGAASFRGDSDDVRREHWSKAARELAKSVLRGTPFSPFAPSR